MSTGTTRPGLEKLHRELAELAGSLDSLPSGRVEKRRDLTLIRLAGSFYLVVACDSDGGIGPKPNDTVAVPAHLLGRLAARVPLMEMLASGARPLVLIDTLSVEMEPTGRDIIEGVLVEAALAGIGGEGAVTGSTEDNVPTVATGIGVTVIGLAEQGQLRPGTSRPGDAIVAIGRPKSAPADRVTADDPETAGIPDVLALLRLPSVHDILPVGSKGIAYEARQMAASAGLTVDLSGGRAAGDGGVNLEKSAGPSTCVLASVSDGSLEALLRAAARPAALVGRLRP